MSPIVWSGEDRLLCVLSFEVTDLRLSREMCFSSTPSTSELSRNDGTFFKLSAFEERRDSCFGSILEAWCSEVFRLTELSVLDKERSSS